MLWLPVAALWLGFEPPQAAQYGLAILPVAGPSLLILGFGLWLLAPPRRSAGLGAAVAALCWGLWWGFDRPPPGILPQDAAPVRVLTYNVGHLHSPQTAAPPDLHACVADVLAQAKAEIALFQEITPEDLDALATRSGATCAHVRYFTPPIHTEGGFGICAMPHSAWALEVTQPMTLGLENSMQVLTAQFTGPQARSLSLWGAHLKPHKILQTPVSKLWTRLQAYLRVSADQSEQAERILALLPPDHVLLAGDFNAAPDMPLHRKLRTALLDAWSAGPTRAGATVTFLGLGFRSDYLYGSRDMGVSDARVVHAACSDHDALVATWWVPASPPPNPSERDTSTPQGR